MSNQRKSLDRRVLKTKRAIRNAFARLLGQKEINDITVRDIAELADINRKTFYNYYDGIYQVLGEIEDELAGKFSEVLSELDLRHDMEHPYIIFQKLSTVLNTDMDFYGYLLSMTKNAGLITKLTVVLKEKTKQSLRPQLSVDEPQLDVMLDFCIAGMLRVYQNWFNSDRTQSIEKISELVGHLWFHGFNGALGLA